MTQNIPSLIFSSRRLLVIFLSLHLLTFSGLVQSAPLFLQSPLDGGDGVDSYTPVEYADNFFLNVNATITGIQWWGFFDDDITADITRDIFNIHFYDDNSGVPGALLGSSDAVTATRNLTSLSEGLASEPVFRFDASLLSPLSFMANTTYYVSIMRIDSNDEYYWLQSATPTPLPPGSSDSYFHRNHNTAGAWSKQGNYNLAFNLVPEPSLPVLLSIGLLCFISYRRVIKT